MKKSKWQQGVDLYVEELRERLADNNLPATSENLLNGARNWLEYSEGCGALIYDADIAYRLCTQSEIKRLTRKDGSLRDPNREENWIELQARALRQAERIILRRAKR